MSNMRAYMYTRLKDMSNHKRKGFAVPSEIKREKGEREM